MFPRHDVTSIFGIFHTRQFLVIRGWGDDIKILLKNPITKEKQNPNIKKKVFYGFTELGMMKNIILFH